ncbi:hypothetical protein PsAD26_01815 [Pseudovibrio sp. Ad26]|nr:hypothetical protein PsAD26_01815 [Pseudovibrio sp. Ad26]
MRKVKSIGRTEAILFWGISIASFLLHLAPGDVVVAQKQEHAKYLISLRENPSVWVETNAFLYYAKLAQPWITLPAIAFIILSTIIRNKCRDQ